MSTAGGARTPSLVLLVVVLGLVIAWTSLVQANPRDARRSAEPTASYGGPTALGREPGVERHKFSRPLYWPTSAVWTSALGRDLLVVDVLQDRLLLSSSEGDLAELPETMSAARTLAHPSQVRSSGEFIWVEDEAQDTVTVFDRESLALVRQIRIEETRFESPDGDSSERLDVIYDWIPVSNGLLVFGDAERSDAESEETSWSMVLAFLGPDGSADVVRRFPISWPERQRYKESLRYFAEAAGSGFVLLFGDQTQVLKVDPAGNVTELVTLPEELTDSVSPTVPRAAGLDGPARATRFYRNIEEADRVLYGLYGAGDKLFLLLRERYAATSLATWELVPVDPRSGSLGPSVLVPSRAPHLGVVPGESSWALIEKSGVEGVPPYEAPFMQSLSLAVFRPAPAG
ncbi:MAG: hypothetical protein KDD47_16140 [Acidobacteria bacterium]|nr:hypothetical protein [Acidobacteriota bacterium]